MSVKQTLIHLCSHMAVREHQGITTASLELSVGTTTFSEQSDAATCPVDEPVANDGLQTQITGTTECLTQANIAQDHQQVKRSPNSR